MNFFLVHAAWLDRHIRTLHEKLHKFMVGSFSSNATAAELQARKVAADPMVLPSFITGHTVLVLGVIAVRHSCQY